MSLEWRELVTELFFLTGIFALLFVAISSSSEEIGLRLIAHPIPSREAQLEPLGLP